MEIEQTKFCRRRKDKVKYIVIHCSAGSPEWMTKIFNEYKVSTHYIIGHDGQAYEMCSPDKTAYHAGVSQWNGSRAKSLNDCSIGIELETRKLGQVESDYTPEQMETLVKLTKKLCKTYEIKPENVLGHSDISPNRKPDPGIAFPWQKMAEYGLGVWYDENKFSPTTDEKILLSKIGYNTDDLNGARYSFCRHFYPEDIKVVEDVTALVSHPIEKNFEPKNTQKYLQILRATAHAYETVRAKEKNVADEILKKIIIKDNPA